MVSKRSGQSTVAVEYCKPGTGGIASAHHQHSFNVSEQAVVFAINNSELCSLSIPSGTFKNYKVNFSMGAAPASCGTKIRPLVIDSNSD